MASFGLELTDFATTYEETSTQSGVNIVVRVYEPKKSSSATRNLLGFISFSGKTGVVEIVNRQAAIEPWHLGIGGTSKSAAGNQAGAHGEGFKLAALVLLRAGIESKIWTSGYSLEFGFGNNKPELFVRMLKSSVTTLQAALKDHVGQHRNNPLLYNIWEDVCIRLQTKRGEASITADMFRSWLECCLDINPPQDMVRTEAGDLIFDARYLGKTYLKGLSLPQTTSTAKTFRYGYNFAKGKINRDREHLSDPVKEAEYLRVIWENAIEEQGRPAVMKYTDLLQNDKEAADIHHIKYEISGNIAKKIWSFMLEEAQVKSPNAFYYKDTDGSDEYKLQRDEILRLIVSHRV